MIDLQVLVSSFYSASHFIVVSVSSVIAVASSALTFWEVFKITGLVLVSYSMICFFLLLIGAIVAAIATAGKGE